MSLVSNLSDLTTRIASEFKALRTLINGNTADLTGLSTTSKTNLVSAINEVKNLADTAMSEGGAQTLDELDDVFIGSGVTAPADGHILRFNGTQFVNVLGTTHYETAGAAASAQSAAISASQPRDSDLTAIAALTTSAYGRSLLELADQAALMGLVPAASETVAGKIEISTAAENTTGTDNTRAVSPAGLAGRLANFQPLDSDLTAIAALTTTTYGRAFLGLADQAALMALMRVASDTATGIVELATSAETATGTDATRAVTPAGVKPLLDAKANTSSLAAVATSGDAADLTGTLPASVLPPLAVNETFVVASQAAMLALTAQRGDVAVRSDINNTYILAADDATVLSNWVELTAAGDVVSVAGKTGAVTLVKGDVGLGNVDNTSDANKPVSTAQQTALNGKEGTITAGTTTQYWRGDKTWQTLNSASVGLGNVDNTSDANKPVSTAVQTALNGKVSTTGAETIAGVKTFSSPPIVPTPVGNTDAANKAYADTKAPSSHTHTLDHLPDAWVKRAVRVATTGSLGSTASTATTLTIPATTAIDGITLAANDRILVKNEATTARNGIYVYTNSTTLTRAADADAATELAGATVSVDLGTANSGKIFSSTFPSNGTINTTAVTFYEVLDSRTSYALSSHNHSGVYEPVITAGTTSQYWRGDKTWQTLDKTTVGLGNVDNTSDANKPISTAVQTALNGKQPLDATLTALAGVTTTADRVIYATGSDTFAVTTLTTFARSILDDADAAAVRSTIGTYSTTEIGDPNTNFVTTFEAGLV